MFMALIRLFETVSNIELMHYVGHEYYANEIDADVLIFYDIHSGHGVTIHGLSNHRAIKYEYFDDPHQVGTKGAILDGCFIQKLGPRDRCQRALSRGIDFIICPYYDAFFRFLAPHLDGQAEKLLLHFPISPDPQLFQKRKTPLDQRRVEVLANGSTECWCNSLYDFRKWAFCHPKVTWIHHYLRDQNAIRGEAYPDDLLAQFAGGLALADMYAVPKYFEMPLAGMVTFMQWNSDAYRAGFRDGENCIFVEKNNFDERISDFVNHPLDYQSIATKGRELVEHRYTAQHFAQFIYNHIQDHSQSARRLATAVSRARGR
jgi:hypothetical protein